MPVDASTTMTTNYDAAIAIIRAHHAEHPCVGANLVQWSGSFGPAAERLHVTGHTTSLTACVEDLRAAGIVERALYDGRGWWITLHPDPPPAPAA